MGFYDHLNTYNTSYGRKKGWESKCQFDFRPLKVRNHPKLCVCRRATYRWKSLDKGYNFASCLTLIKGQYKKLWAFKVTKVPILRISDDALLTPWIQM